MLWTDMLENPSSCHSEHMSYYTHGRGCSMSINSLTHYHLHFFPVWQLLCILKENSIFIHSFFHSFIQPLINSFIRCLSCDGPTPFLNKFFRECDLVLPFSISSTFYFPYGHPVTLYLFTLYPITAMCPYKTCFRRQFLRMMLPIQLAILLQSHPP
jgi:hypothetical protein